MTLKFLERKQNDERRKVKGREALRAAREPKPDPSTVIVSNYWPHHTVIVLIGEAEPNIKQAESWPRPWKV